MENKRNSAVIGMIIILSIWLWHSKNVTGSHKEGYKEGYQDAIDDLNTDTAFVQEKVEENYETYCYDYVKDQIKEIERLNFAWNKLTSSRKKLFTEIVSYGVAHNKTYEEIKDVLGKSGFSMDVIKSQLDIILK